MLQIDGSLFSGSGTLVRQSVMLSALTGRAVHIVNCRLRRPKPGLRPQHIRVVEAIGQLVGAKLTGAAPGSTELTFHPRRLNVREKYDWNIGSAGSTTLLAVAVLPVLAFGRTDVAVEIRGGLFQDYAPSAFHLQYVIIPLLRRMGLESHVEMRRPGYVPSGEGVLSLTVKPVRSPLQSLDHAQRGALERIWGVALASHLDKRRVTQRMADSFHKTLGQAGYDAAVEVRHETTARQAGAAMAAFADFSGEVRLGADRAGALGRPAEKIGSTVAHHLLEELEAGATLDRYAADQVLPFAALAEGTSRFQVPTATDHLPAVMWLVHRFLGVEATLTEGRLTVPGMGFWGER